MSHNFPYENISPSKGRDLFIIRNKKLIIFPYDIEMDIKDKLNYDVSQMSFSNGEFNVGFYISEKIDFKLSRNVKKYFMDSLPMVVKVSIDKGFIIVYFTRKFGLDTIELNYSV